MALQVLVEIKCVFKEDAGLEFNIHKTSVLPKGVSQQAAFDVTQSIFQTTPTLNHLSGDVTIGSFCPEGFVGIGVTVDTDAFVWNFVAKTCRAIIDDIENLDDIQDVDFKIADTLLKKSTKQHTDSWDASSKVWAHMVLHLPHVEGGFGVTFNDVTKDDMVITPACPPSRYSRRSSSQI